MRERSQLSLLEIPIRTNVKGKIGLSPVGAFQPGKMTNLPFNIGLKREKKIQPSKGKWVFPLLVLSNKDE
jgi:hypothetical protein